MKKILCETQEKISEHKHMKFHQFADHKIQNDPKHY